MDSLISFLLSLDYASYWGVFFFGLLISTTAMSTGIDGAAFWAPVFLLVYKVDPKVAVACAIFIELFGFSSGVVGYVRKKKILYKKALTMLIVSIPFAIAGAFLSKIIPSFMLIIIIGVCSSLLVVFNLYQTTQQQKEIEDHHSHKLVNKPLGMILTAIGGLFDGAVGLGLGETNNYYLANKNKFNAAYAAGTSVFMIAINGLACNLFNGLYFHKYSNLADWNQVASILIFAIPSVLIGAQIGVHLVHRFKKIYFNYLVAAVFAIVAVVDFYRGYMAYNPGEWQIFVASLLGGV
ncbi:MAG TPA: sulfite exporter TauE/SafE family protein [Candidatus Gracilibacteria bacterium]|nr:sulfite exporter TauE/SafE family protein [Candidatus Gracilibacteria bacterium]